MSHLALLCGPAMLILLAGGALEALLKGIAESIRVRRELEREKKLLLAEVAERPKARSYVTMRFGRGDPITWQSLGEIRKHVKDLWPGALQWGLPGV